VTLCENDHDRIVIGARAREWASTTFRTRNAAAEFVKMI